MKFATSRFLTLAAIIGTTTAQSQTILDVVVGSPDHTTLEAAVLAAPAFIAETLGDTTATLTLFAPDDTAFTNLIAAVGEDYVNDLLTAPWSAHLTCVLTSHVLGSVVLSTDITGPSTVATLSGYEVSVDNVGGTVTVDDIPVTVADIAASNGVVHSITALPILPPCVTTNIYDLGASLPDFSTLISLIDAAGLKDAVSTTRPLTVFAPTNAAFDKVPKEILNFLASNVDALTQVLTYHVVNDLILFGDNTDRTGETFKTLNGDSVTLGDLTVDGIAIDSPDVLASNGLVQVIGAVLIPPSLVLPPLPTPVAAPVPSPVGKKGAPYSAPVSAPVSVPVSAGGGKGGKKGGKGGKKGGKGGKKGGKGGEGSY